MVTCLRTTFTRYIIRDPVVVDGADALRVVQDNPILKKELIRHGSTFSV